MKYFLIGIKGSGMASIAQILLDQGHEVSGSDIENHIFTQDILEQRNIKIYPFNPDNIKANMIVVIGNSFNEDHIEVKQAKKLKLKTYRYVELLAKMIEEYNGICISGTHGKTTSTGLVKDVLNIKEKTGYLIGDGHGQLSQDSINFVVESCEYQDNYLNYYPSIALINNIELDHVDYFKSFQQYLDSFQNFANNVKDYVVINGDDINTLKLIPKANFIYFGTNDNADFQAKNIIYNQEGLSFDLYTNFNKDIKEYVYSFKLALYGEHMLMNALAAIAIFVLKYGHSNYQELNDTLSNFKGVARRFEIIEGINGNIFIDDYAHHPTAVALMLKSTRQKYPNKKLIAFFKPDRYSRIYEFGKEIGHVLEEADEVYLFEFPSTSSKEDGIDITMEYVSQACAKSSIIHEDNQAANFFKYYQDSVFLMMSSKNVYDFRDIIINIQKELIE